MNYNNIETFLEVVRTRNITKASNSLYLSQSTVSSRLKSLEDELGFQLIQRSKGRQMVELTQMGEEFIIIAERWKALFEETESIKSNTFHKLKIAVNESTYYTRIMHVMKAFSEENPYIRYEVKICDSEEIYNLVDQGIFHLGFASYESYGPRLRVEEIDRQDLCVITADKPEYAFSQADFGNLDPNLELRFSGGHFEELEKWRLRHFGAVHEPALLINGGFLMIQEEVADGKWALIPYDMAVYLAQRAPIRIHRLHEEMDQWKVYMIRRKEESPECSRIIGQFSKILFRYLKDKRRME